MLSALIFSTAVLVGQRADNGVALLAASSVNPAVVRLRWFSMSGAVPADGVQIVRTGSNEPTHALALVTPASTLLTNSVMATARKPLRAVQSLSVTRQKQSSKIAFRSLAPAMATAKAEMRGAVAPRFQNALKSTATVRDFYSAIKKPAVGEIKPMTGVQVAPRPPNGATKRSASAQTSTQPPMVATPSDGDIVEARATLAMGIFSSDDNAAKIGQGFIDKQVQAGGSYTYELRNRQGAVLATTTVKVGSDTPPPAPVVEPPVQLGQRQAGLHIELPTAVNEADYGKLVFRVSRINPGTTTPVVVDERVAITYHLRNDGNMMANLVTFKDTSAPTTGHVQYLVQTKNIFDQLSAPTTVSVDMDNLATAVPVKAVAASREEIRPTTQQNAHVAPSIRPIGYNGHVYFLPVYANSDEEDVPASQMLFTITRFNTESKLEITKMLPATDLATVSMIDFNTAKLRVVCQLSSDVDKALRVIATNDAAAQTSPDAPSASEIQGEYETLCDMTVSRFIQTHPNATGDVNAKFNAQLGFNISGIRTFTDVNPPDDHFYEYRVSQVWAVNFRSSPAVATNVIGIPALALPGSPQLTTLTDDPAPTNGNLQSGSTVATSNVLHMQNFVGPMGPTGLNPGFTALDTSASVGQRLFAATMAATPPPSNPGSIRRAKKRAYLAAGAGREMARSAVAAIAKKGSAGAAAHYGRKVSITWAAPAYSSDLTFKVYRANATGYVGQRSIGATLAGKAVINKTAIRVADGSLPPAVPFKRPPTTTISTSALAPIAKISGQNLTAAPAKRLGEQIIRSRTEAKFTSAKLAAFRLDSAPTEEEFVLIGSTKRPDQHTFVDLLPRSQANNYYYFVRAVNRWGEEGAPAPAKSIEV